MKLDIGCGEFPKEGYTGIDTLSNQPGVIIHDLEKGLPSFLMDNSVTDIRADNVLEHIRNLIPLMNDCFRIMKPLGTFEIIVPLANTTGALKDPTHVRHFVPESFDYFDKAWDYPRQPNYGIKKWNILEKKVVEENSDYKYIHVILQKGDD